MPIYEYQCQSCEQELEVLQKISDKPLEVCPECGQASLRKKISAAAFRLKGGGWYETDFKTGDKKNLAGEGKAGAEGKDSAGGDKASAGGEKTASSDKGKGDSKQSSVKSDKPAAAG